MVLIIIGVVPFFSGLINDRGRYQQTTLTLLSVFNVSGGNSIYLFRIVGATSRYDFSIDRHTLRVIASDGKNVESKDVKCLSMETGERFDVLVNADQPVGNYWIRAETHQVNVRPGQEHSAHAILSYAGAGNLDWRNAYANVPESRHVCTSESPMFSTELSFSGFHEKCKQKLCQLA